MDSLHNKIGEEELLPFLRERLAAGQTIRYLPFRGLSMLPLLRQGKDAVELSPLPEKLQKYDLPVYQYPSGKVVMHRVVKAEEDIYICLGDNTFEYERIKPEQMIALVSAIKRGERRISVDSLGYRIYSRAWVGTFPLRRAWRRGILKLRALLRPLKAWLRRHMA